MPRFYVNNSLPCDLVSMLSMQLKKPLVWDEKLSTLNEHMHPCLLARYHWHLDAEKRLSRTDTCDCVHLPHTFSRSQPLHSFSKTHQLLPLVQILQMLMISDAHTHEALTSLCWQFSNCRSPHKPLVNIIFAGIAFLFAQQKVRTEHKPFSLRASKTQKKVLFLWYCACLLAPTHVFSPLPHWRYLSVAALEKNVYMIAHWNVCFIYRDFVKVNCWPYINNALSICTIAFSFTL